ncbi:MAG: hypothetical protein KF687_14540 [Cyclobacteriaceae bacterium]|nr:hypothetical protein [Cyclobacteriaceae bacterium]
MTESDEIMNLYKTLIQSDQYTFPSKGKVKISEKHGVYIVYSPTDKVLHVGNTPSGKKGLNQRLYNHVTRTSSFSRVYLKPQNISLRNGYKYRVIEISSPRKRALLEALTAGLLCPAHIGTGEKKKK